MKPKKLMAAVLIAAMVGPAGPFAPFAARAEDPPPPTPVPLQPPGPLSLDVVKLPDLTGVVRDQKALQVLGKALFWDMQAGSDNAACASCHFHAGADSRAKNQLNPGLLRVEDPSRAPDSDNTFGAADNPAYGFVAGGLLGKTASDGTAGPNYTLVPADFPFHQLEDPEDRNSPVRFDTNDVASSQGTFDGTFNYITPRIVGEDCQAPDGVPFNVNGTPIRKVEPRNTPTTINAVFNHRNFWDGRANNIFNGQDPLGKRSPKARVVVYNPSSGGGKLQDFTTVNGGKAARNSSLASQAVGPPLSDFEMSCAGRQFADVGRKLLSLRPLALQEVRSDDSVLGSWRHSSGKGLYVTYARLVMAAFHPDYWRVQGKFRIDSTGEPVLAADSNGYTQMELNFPLYWGLAIQAYEATLVSDKTPFDLFMAKNPNLKNTGEGSIAGSTVTFVDGFGRQELLGLDVFLNKGKCYNCHIGSEFTGASVRLRANQNEGGNEEPIERMAMAVGSALYDGGFYNIGVRPTFEDLGVGAELAGYPLSFARQIVTGNKIDDFNFHPEKFEIPGPIVPGERVAVDGAFKVPTIRNVELTGPYFHNGGEATLRQVVEFYDRGGSRRDKGCDSGQGDTSGFGDAGDRSECSNLDPDIVNLRLTEDEVDALVAFMLALTDPRVKNESAPFDHPELRISNGQKDASPAEDIIMTIPAVGKNGRSAQGLPQVGRFLGLDPFRFDTSN